MPVSRAAAVLAPLDRLAAPSAGRVGARRAVERLRPISNNGSPENSRKRRALAAPTREARPPFIALFVGDFAEKVVGNAECVARGQRGERFGCA